MPFVPLRNPDIIKDLRSGILNLRKLGMQEKADQKEKFLAYDLVPNGWVVEISRPGDSRTDTPNYPFDSRNIIIATPEEVPALCNKKGLILKGAPVKIWERESLSWRDFPAGEGNSKLQAVVAVETTEKPKRSMIDILKDF